MNDRNAAIKALERAWNYLDVQNRTFKAVVLKCNGVYDGVTVFDETLDGIKDAIALLKAQDPKIGHWVDKCCRDFHCSECNHKLIDNRWIHADGYCYDDLPKYCPECGVKMGRGIIQMRFAGEDKIVYPDYEKRAK